MSGIFEQIFRFDNNFGNSTVNSFNGSGLDNKMYF